MEDKKKKHHYYNKQADLGIIKDTQDLILYSHILLKKYPSSEILASVSSIKNTLYDILEFLINAKLEKNTNSKSKQLICAASKISYLYVLVMLSKKLNYINKRNYAVWCNKIYHIEKSSESWLKYCQR